MSEEQACCLAIKTKAWASLADSNMAKRGLIFLKKRVHSSLNPETCIIKLLQPGANVIKLFTDVIYEFS